jgi:hypothetical protein
MREHDMDINSLLAGEQVSLLRAQFATQGAAKQGFLDLASGYSERIRKSVYPHRALVLAKAT